MVFFKSACLNLKRITLELAHEKFRSKTEPNIKGENFTMNKQVKAVIGVVLAVWFFFMGFEIGSFNEKKKVSKEAPVTTAPVIATQAQTTAPTADTAPSTDETSAPVSDNNNETTKNEGSDKPSQQDTTKKNSEGKKDPSQMSSVEILAAVTSAMNKLAKEQNFTAERNEKVTIELTDLSVSSLKSMVNRIIQSLAGDETSSITFTNGLGSGKDGKDDVTDVKVFDVIPPKDGFKLPLAGVQSAKATKNGDSITYEIVLVEESTTFTAPIPQYNSAAFSYLDLTSIDISGAQITDANMHYPGTTVTVTVDGEGRITNIHYYMPMDGNGSAKVIGLSGSATFQGSDDESWTITY